LRCMWEWSHFLLPALHHNHCCHCHLWLWSSLFIWPIGQPFLNTLWGVGVSFCLIIILHVNTPECQSVTLYWLSIVSSSFFMAYVWVFFNCCVISCLILEVCDSGDECPTVWTCGVEMAWAQFPSCLEMKSLLNSWKW
jgi:hypothetical protein